MNGDEAEELEQASEPKAIAAQRVGRSRRPRQMRNVTTPSATYATRLTYRRAWTAVCKVGRSLERG